MLWIWHRSAQRPLWRSTTQRQLTQFFGQNRTGSRRPRNAFVTRDTALFQGLARSVQYGDFIAKAILYDDLTKRQKKSHKEAAAGVSEAFVNYNFLAGRDRQYPESVGLLWFWNYKIRIMKIAAYNLRHNPLRSLLMTAVPVGSPMSDNIGSMWASGDLPWSMGVEMGLNSFHLNPWINGLR